MVQSWNLAKLLAAFSLGFQSALKLLGEPPEMAHHQRWRYSAKAGGVMNPLEKIDECLKENVLNLWEPVHELIEHSGECGMIDFLAFIPEHEQASCDHTDFTGELTKKYGVPFRVLQDRLFPQEVAQEKAITPVYGDG